MSLICRVIVIVLGNQIISSQMSIFLTVSGIDVAIHQIVLKNPGKFLYEALQIYFKIYLLQGLLKGDLLMHLIADWNYFWNTWAHLLFINPLDSWDCCDKLHK